MKKLVLTGAAGRLGSYLREPLSKLADELVSTDLADGIGTLYPGETYVQADIADKAAVEALLEGADMVVHFGNIADEAPFEDILGPNIVGSYNVWRAAEIHGVRRVVYASSIHAVGMHDRTERITPHSPHRPDGFYGLSKCFTEDLARLYWDKFQIESVCLRIISCAQVTNARALGTHLSYDDLIQLVERSIDTPYVGFTVIYGVSNNDRSPVDNSSAAFLGYRPTANAEEHAARILAEDGLADLADPGKLKHGGPFAAARPGESGQAQMNIPDDRKTN